MDLERLAVPAVYTLIFFLAFSSQWLLLKLEPFPPRKEQFIGFNILLAGLLISYTRSVLEDPGHILRSDVDQENKSTSNGVTTQPRKWCRKCNAAKPPRTHHCRVCGRCIPKMDHHCPWTQNCVSYTTFPHFLRFLFYAVASMMYLFNLLWPRISHIWSTRHMPSYLGPSVFQLAHVFALSIANSVTLFALTVLLIRNIWGLSVNTTTIEGWEIERHQTLVRRARYFGGWLDGPDGVKVQILKQEFPFDIGIWKNIKQGMGTGNVLAWFWPLSSTPSMSEGFLFETNGFEDPSISWPPPDPDRLQRKQVSQESREGPFLYSDSSLTTEEAVAAFRQRQREDSIRRRKPFIRRVESQESQRDSYREEVSESEEILEKNDGTTQGSQSGEEAWKNSEGERLRDFGLDEDVEFYDEEDDIPLSELIAMRRGQRH